MDISVFGLGYVGCVATGCLAELGHRVVGVDIDEAKVALINSGQATVVEERIADIIACQRRDERIRGTLDAAEAVAASEISLICVGTPSTEQGHLNLGHVFHVAEQIGAALADKDEFHTVALRSTVPPGTNRRFAEIVAAGSGKREAEHFAVISHPEFLREGSSVKDFFHPPMIVLGSDNKRGLAALREMYRDIEAPVFETQIGAAEIIKYINNSYHALKVAFANEIGRICKHLGIDAQEVMRIFCADKELNISSAYFQPGFAYGGSCLPKDLFALRTLAHDNYVKIPVIDAVPESNQEQKRAALRLIEQIGKNRIAFLGLSFKAGTDDLRNSPAVDLVEQLIGKGYELSIHDGNVTYSNLTGRNKEYINDRLPHVAKLLLPDIEQVLEGAELIVIGNSNPAYREVAQRTDIAIVDLVGLLSPDCHKPIARLF